MAHDPPDDAAQADAPAPALPTTDEVMGLLRGVIDPELGLDIVELGMAKGARIGPDGVVALDAPAGVAVLPTTTPAQYSRRSFEQQLADLAGDRTNSDFVLGALSETFTRRDLDFALDELRDQSLTRGAAVRTIDTNVCISASLKCLTSPKSNNVTRPSPWNR